MRNLHTPLFGAIAGAVSTLLFLAAVAGAAPTTLGVNIVVNGGAEAGQGAPNDGMPLMDIPGWERTGNFEVTQYGASGGFPDRTSPGPAARGKNFFNGGPGNPQSSATQTIPIAGLDALVDSHKVAYIFSAYLGGYSNQNDHASLSIQFKSAAGDVLGSAHLGPVMAADRKGSTGLYSRTTSGSIPAGTRQATVTITVTRTDGSYNDGSVDNISLILKKRPS